MKITTKGLAVVVKGKDNEISEVYLREEEEQNGKAYKELTY